MSGNAYPGLILSQRPVQVQKLVMTPQLQAAIRLLALPRVELEQAIQKELMDNPLIEDTGPEIESDRYPGGKHGAAEYKDFETWTASSETLMEHVLAQVAEAFDDGTCRIIAATIAGSLDRDGFLTLPTDEVAALCREDLSQVEGVLDIMQTFEPAGVCARDLRECLLLQTARLPHLPGGVDEIIRHHLHHLEIHNYRRISKDTGLPIGRVLEALEIIRQLEPKPGRSFNNTVSRYVEPDLYVVRHGGGFKVITNDRGLPALRVSDEYYRLLKGRQQAEEGERAYLIEKLKSARWFVKSIRQRRQTVRRVMEVILDFQQAFFEHGPAYLKPMVLKDISGEIDVAESTVSRAVSDKYVQTPHGIIPMKSFFSSAVPGANGVSISSSVVKNLISELVSGEDKRKPLSDDRITALLKESGISVARRTVAKYRGQLGILSSSRRKVIL